jgi:hypothetical protein
MTLVSEYREPNRLWYMSVRGCVKLYHTGKVKGPEDDLLYRVQHLVPAVNDPQWLHPGQWPMVMAGIVAWAKRLRRSGGLPREGQQRRFLFEMQALSYNRPRH